MVHDSQAHSTGFEASSGYITNFSFMLFGLDSEWVPDPGSMVSPLDLCFIRKGLKGPCVSVPEGLKDITITIEPCELSF